MKTRARTVTATSRRRPAFRAFARAIVACAGAAFVCALFACALVVEARAAAPSPGPPLTIRRATGPITVDGDLDDAGWQGADSIATWFETNPGDNVPPKVGNVAWLAYDDTYLYAAFRFDDPHPEAIRAPLGDHDAVPSSTDYGGLIVDSHNDGKTAQMFLANPRGVQYDAVSSDASGEDNSPDFFWESRGRITSTGWNLEIRIPFSSLRYGQESEPVWGLLLYRNHPRDRRYQYFTARLPRDVNCFICNSSKLTGLESLPRGSHVVVAPFATASQTSERTGPLGSSLEAEDVDTEAGVDVKWNPSAGLAIDGTVNPDFSQVEADAAQIVANERFALFFPEKRPFFLEGVDLFATPFQAVYTRTVTAPQAGLRATGRIGNTAYTALATRDEGGGRVILPGPQGSHFRPQDFRSDVGVVRVRHDLGPSFVSFLTTAREIDGGGYNRVFGPDLQWRPRPVDNVTAQVLWSETETPNRPDLNEIQWDGRRLSDHAARLDWSHATPHHDWYVLGMDVGDEFRADDGFIPQVGYREGYLDGGLTFRPKDAFLSRIRVFTTEYVDVDLDGDVLSQRVSLGSGMDGRWNSFIRVEVNEDAFRVGEVFLRRFRPRLHLESSPGRFLNYFSIDALFGQEIDFTNAREGTGTSVTANTFLRPNEHLELRFDAGRRQLDVDAEGGRSGTLFTAQVERVRATWAFDARSFVRVIGQYERTSSDTSLYTPENAPFFAPKDADFTLSALFAFKLNWQTVFYLGYGDQRVFAESTDRLEPDSRQVFAKVSYAWQR